MTFEEYTRKKKKEELTVNDANTVDSFSDYTRSVLGDEAYEKHLQQESRFYVPTPEEHKQALAAAKEDSTWFQSGAFSDGYQFGDVLKTVRSSLRDLENNITAGILGMGESIVDAGAFLVGGVGGLFSEDFKKDTQDFIAKDLYDEKAIAKELLGKSDITEGWLTDVDNWSVFGDKSDSLAQSGGQLLTTVGLQAVGVPWWLTTGVTSFGSEVDNAFDQGATYTQAGLSGAITTAADIFTEKISGGISFGAGTLDDLLTRKLATGITNKTVRSLTKFGLDVTGEGFEEVLSQAISNLGSSLYREENLKDILFSEEAVDEYIDSFVGGAVLGGVSSGVKLADSAVKKTDTVTGLTANEEKVLQKVYQERVAEAEESGKKLTASEKNSIYDEVMRDLEKGYISTDTIESVLGGESYKSYQDAVDNEEAILKEFAELGEMKKSDFTAKQEDRYNELKEIVAELKNSNTRDQLKTKLRDDVFALAKDSKLAESYNERTRRSQAYEADVTKYDAKQQTVVQKAIDSGILNNTNRTHEFVDMIAKISADKGVLFDFTNNAKLKESGFAVDGKSVNGYVTKDGVTVNIDSKKSLNSIVGHEITHVLEGTEFYAELQKAVAGYAKIKKDYDGRRKALEDLYKDIENANIDAELTADLVGDYLFTDADFINHLSTKNRNVFQKMYDEVKYLWKVATAGSKEKRELEKVKRTFDKAYKNSGKASADTKYSISTKEDADYLDAVRRGDMATAQKMVDEMAREVGYSVKAYHGGDKFFTVFGKGNKTSQAPDGAHFFSSNKDVAYSYTTYKKDVNLNVSEHPVYKQLTRDGTLEENRFSKGGVYPVYLKMKNPYVVDFGGEYYSHKINGMDINETAEYARANGYDGVIAKNIKDPGDMGDANYESAPTLAVADDYIVFNSNQIKSAEAVTYDDNGNIISLSQRFNAESKDIRYSLSDSDGKKLTKEQSEYFKNSKMRDEDGNLKVMYHGSQDAGFHTFDPRFSDDDTSFFFVDRNDVATTYSGSTEVYEARTIRTAEDMNNFLSEIGEEDYKVVEKDGKFTLLQENEYVADSDTAQGIYEEYCDWVGVGYGDANYKVYLNLTNPLEVDAKGRPWNKIDAEFSQEVYDKFQSLTTEEKDALHDLAEWEDFSLFNREIQLAESGALASAYAKMGEDINKYDLFSVATDNFEEESLRENSRYYLKTRDFAKRAKEQGYDGVIFKNILDGGPYSNGSEGAATVAVAFEPNQIKSTANEKPTAKADIRYSLSEDSEGRTLSEEQKKYFNGSKVVDDNGNLKVVYHGSPSDFNTFSLKYLGTNGTAEGYGFYFTDSKRIAEGYSKGREGQQNGDVGKLFEVYLDIKKPLSDTDVTIPRAQFRKFLIELNKQVDADGEPLDILSNYGDVSWEGLNSVLNTALETEYNFSSNDVDMICSVINMCGDKETVFNVLRKVTGHDGIIVKEASWGGDQTIYIAFHPEQIKNVDNQNPTSDPDIRRSISAENEAPIKRGNYNVYGDDVRLDTSAKEEIAPVREDVSVLETTTPTVSKKEQVEDIAPINSEPNPTATLHDLNEERKALEEKVEAAVAANDQKSVTSLMERYSELSDEIKQAEEEEKAVNSERLSSLDDADAPPEVEAPYYGETEAFTPEDPFENRNMKEVSKDRRAKAYMFENPEVKPFFQAEANRLLGELDRAEPAQSYYNGWAKWEMSFEAAQDIPEVYRTKRVASPSIVHLRDDVKMSYDDIRKGLNAIIKDNGAENIAAAKKIEFELNDRLLKGYIDDDGYEIPADQDYINLLKDNQITEYSDEARKSIFDVADDYAPVVESEVTEEISEAPIKEAYEAIKPKQSKEPKMIRLKESEDIAPTATYETAKSGNLEGQRTMFEEGKTAKILTEEEKTDKKKRSAWSMFKNNMLDKGMVFEDLSLKTGNRELQARWNSIRYAEGKAQKLIGEGNSSVSSLKSIQETVEKSGKTEQFYEYLYHKHNVDRMSLEKKAEPTIAAYRGKFGHLKIEQVKAIAAKEITNKTTERTAETIREAREYLNAVETKNKPVFGDSVTAEVSQETAAKLEKANPEFKEYAKEVYDYTNYLRDLMVDAGVISSDTAKLWSEIYPHYVPIRRTGKEGLAVNVPLDTGKTGINAPIKRATGGNSDILPLFDTMALRTEQTYRAIAKNRFGVELKNTLGTTISDESAGLDDAINSLDEQDGLLQEGKNGNSPTFTVFENGKKVTFEITEEMYDAIKPTSKGLTYTNKVANTAGKFFRGLLTEYNPVFMATNAVKDVQDVLINSQHAAKTYSAIPKAILQMATKGHWYQEYMENGGERNTYFDGDSKTFKAEDKGFKKLIGMPLRAISFLNNTIERVPRLAEYIASRESGRSVDVSMLDAARVTTNFAAGGDVTKFANRNGFNFLNASVQGAVQQVRNVREAKANGFKGWLHLATKVAIAGIPALILNDLLWDDDEEYEELSDYVKDNYYVVAKFGDGQFVRIPKGRTLAVIQDALEQTRNALTGEDEVDLNNFLDLAISNLAPNNPLENNILAPIIQAANNKTWYGDDLVPTRLQNLPASEQYDESIDSISKWLGEKTGFSPYKINYLLDQYSGGLGDVFLPMLTPEAERGDNSLGGKLLAPWKDKFTTDSVMNNQNVSDFYDTVGELAKNANSMYATDEDVLKYKYMNSINADLSELYAQKREIQNGNLPDDKKYNAVRKIQEQINALTKDSLNTYNNVNIDGGYATVGNLHYRINKYGEWEKISAKQLEKQNEVTNGLGISASDYWSNKEEYDYAYDSPGKYAVAKSVGGYEKYKTYSSELYDIKADKDEDGKSISGSRKEKVIEYINNLDADYGEKIILFKSEYNADDTYNYEIIDYLNSREDISYEDMATILKELGFTVLSDGTIKW